MTVDPDALLCGCRWRRDPQFGDVLDQCAEHRAETDQAVRRTDAKIWAENMRRARGGMDRELDQMVRRRR